MDNDTTQIEPPETRTPPPRPPLVRPVAGRMVAGVAAGLARALNIPVGMVRFLFIIMTVFAGTGLALYLAAWALLRSEDASQSPAEQLVDDLRSGQSWIGIGLLVIAAVIVLGNITFLSGSVLWATVLIVAGVVLYRSESFGRQASPPPPPTQPPSSPDSGSSASGFGGVAPALGSDAALGSEAAPPSGAAVPPPSAPPPYVSDSPPSPPPAPFGPPQPRSILGRLTIGVGLLAMGILAIIDNISVFINPQPRHYLALATVVLGVGLLTGAFAGRARWLILLGIFVLPPLAASPLAEVNWSADFDRTVRPVDPSTISQEYRVTAGSYRFDLTDTDWNGETVGLNVEMAAGEIVIYLPPGVGLEGRAQVNVGELDTPAGHKAGLGDLAQTFNSPGEKGTVELDLNLGFGSVRVSYEEPGQTGEFNGFGVSTTTNEGDQ